MFSSLGDQAAAHACHVHCRVYTPQSCPSAQPQSASLFFLWSCTSALDRCTAWPSMALQVNTYSHCQCCDQLHLSFGSYPRHLRSNCTLLSVYSYPYCPSCSSLHLSTCRAARICKDYNYLHVILCSCPLQPPTISMFQLRMLQLASGHCMSPDRQIFE